MHSVQVLRMLGSLGLIVVLALLGACADKEPGEVAIGLEVCGDGFDNDNDGATDCDDDDCAEFVECGDTPDPEICDDEIDNDEDGDTDCDDADCEDEEACDEPPVVDEVCDDEIDNDEDGDIDCDDIDCEDDDACEGPFPDEICDDEEDNDQDGDIDCDDDDCAEAENCVGPPDEVCDDGEDNDEDGDTDCADDDCTDDPACQEVCDDGEDNDLDEAVDCADEDCVDAPECQEVCDDGEDNDLDEAVDCADEDCFEDPACQEVCDSGEDEDLDGDVDCADEDCFENALCIEICDDGEDNDQDDLVDCADEDCVGTDACLEICDDGEDNDLDGDFDCDDEDCFEDALCIEICDDGEDNDQDEAVDCDDEDCADERICFIPDVAEGAVIFTELMYDPEDPLEENNAEWIELFNTTDGDLDLTNCVLSDTSDASETLFDLTIPAGGFILLASSDDPEVNGGLTVDGTFGFSLNNSGDTLTLTCDDTEVDTVAYDDGESFPDAQQASIQLSAVTLDGEDNDLGANWCLARDAYFDAELATAHLGSPGQANFECLPPEDLCDDELDNDQDGDFDCDDEDCAEDPFCVILDFEICDDGIDNDRNDALDCLDPGCEDDIACLEICDDEVDNNQDGDIDCDDPDCEGDPICIPIPDVSEGEVIITEIMYDTQTPIDEGNGEWIELFNTNEVPVDISGCILSDTSQTSTLLLDIVIPPGQHALLARSDNPELNGGLEVDGTFDFGLNNTGDTVTLTCAEVVVDTVSYDDGPEFPDARQTSIQLDLRAFDAAQNDDGINWCFPEPESTYFTDEEAGSHLGTPGFANDPCPPPPEICDDEIDNDRDEAVDCDDPDCEDAPNCIDPGLCPEPVAIITAPGTFEGDTSDSPNDFVGDFCEAGDGPEDIYQFVAPADLTVCIDTLGTEFDTTLYVHNAPCGEKGSEFECNDDIFFGKGEELLQSQLELEVIGGESIFIFVDGFDEAEFGVYALNIGFGPCTTPGPEICDDGRDNDLDDAVDCADEDCEDAPECQEVCDDNEDNDLDGDTDCEDEDCANDVNCIVPDVGVGAVIITEIMYDTQAPISENNGEWIEIINIGEEDVDLTGCVLSDTSQTSTLLVDIVVPFSNHVLLARSDNPELNGGLEVDGTFDFGLNNSGDTITITCGDTVVDTVSYDDGPEFPNAQQASIQVDREDTDFEANDIGANWCIAPPDAIYFDNGPGTAHRGTPGELNPPCPEPTAFNAEEVQTLLDRDCTGCHGVNFPSGGVTLVDFEPNTIFQTGGAGITLIVPGDPDASYLLAKLKGTQFDLGGFGSRMPQGGPFWNPLEIAGLELYIEGLQPPP